MALQREVGGRLANAPNLHRSIQRGASKGIGVLGIENDLKQRTPPCMLISLKNKTRPGYPR